MSQPVTSSRLTNSAVNINGATTAVITNYGLARIGVTGNSFDISSSSGNVTLGITGTGNVQIGNATSGTVSLPGVTTFASLNGATTTSTINVGSNLIAGGIVTLGSTTSTTNLFGTLDVATIEGPTAGSALAIGNNITAGSVSIGNAGGPNTVTIGNNGASITGTVNVGVSSSTVTIGNTGAAMSMFGSTVNIGNPLSIITIGNGPAFTGTIGIASGSSTRGIVDIGTTGTANLNIGSTGAPLTLRGSSTTFSSPLTLGAAPTAGSTASSPYLGSYYTPVSVGFPNTSTNLSIINIGSPGIYLVRINVQLTLAVANVSANAYLGSVPGMNAGTSIGFSMPYASGGFQAADVNFVVNVATTYTYQINIIATTSAIATNGIGCSFSWVRIA